MLSVVARRALQADGTAVRGQLRGGHCARGGPFRASGKTAGVWAQVYPLFADSELARRQADEDQVHSADGGSRRGCAATAHAAATTNAAIATDTAATASKTLNKDAERHDVARRD